MHKNSFKYPVEFVDDLFGESTALADAVGTHKVLLVADQNVVQHHPELGTRIGAYVKAHALSLAGAPVVLLGGERLKMNHFQGAFRVVDAALTARLTADDYILAIGGGTLLDVAGWAASQVRGGVKLIRVPTTPAAILGAAFAETAALDTMTVKDALVVKSTPSQVFLSIPLATTVLDGAWRAGFSEAARLFAAYAPKLIESRLLPLAEAYVKRQKEAFVELAKATLELRMKKGNTDLGLAASANLEPRSNWKLPSGYAIAIGILIEMKENKNFEQIKNVLKVSGALEGLHYSRHILPPEIANF